MDDRRPGGGFIIRESTAFRLRAAAIVWSTVFVVIGSFGADFISYDDSAHIANTNYANASSIWDYFVPKTSTNYLPLTFISYKADKWLHEGWSNALFKSWAPGVRLDSLLIHATAALILWRLLVNLRLSERRAFFIALIFACHPLACETLCWVSERKNTLAACFGFGALWVQSCAFAKPKPPDSSAMRFSVSGIWRQLLMCIFYVLGLIGKPSVLGVLPILILLECAVLFPAIRSRLFNNDDTGGADTQIEDNRPWTSVVGFVLLGAITYACLRVNLYAASTDLMLPPGGTIFTALLTDLDIFSRYMFNLACPTNLSAMYYVREVTSLGDPRVWIYGMILTAAVSGTIYFGRNRWIAGFGWYWFFSAVSTNANLIAFPHWMHDRYIYLSTPGFFIATSECLAGLARRYGDERQRRQIGLAFGTILSVAFMAISASRSFLWESTFKLAVDATQKQPLSFFAHYTLSCTLYPPGSLTKPGTPEYAAVYRAWRKELLTALYDCPDSDRYNMKQVVATELGKDAYGQGDAEAAEKYFKIGITKLSLAPDFAEPHGISLAYLSMLDLYHKRDPQVALQKAKEAFRLCPSEQGRFALSNAYVACAQRSPQERPALLAEARIWLDGISKDSPIHEDAEMLRHEIDKLLSEKPAQPK